MIYFAFSDEKHKIAGRKLLKLALAEQGIYDYEIKYGEFGKPYIEGVEFSISHSKRLIAVMIENSPCGVDVQAICHVKDGVIRRVCNEREIEKIENAADKNKCFCKIWASKESHVKMTGTGFTKGYKNIKYNAKTVRIGDYIIACSPKITQTIKWVRI